MDFGLFKDTQSVIPDKSEKQLISEDKESSSSSISSNSSSSSTAEVPLSTSKSSDCMLRAAPPSLGGEKKRTSYMQIWIGTE